MSRRRTRRRPTHDRPGVEHSTADRTSRTIEPNGTPKVEPSIKLVRDADVTGRPLTGHDLVDFAARFGPTAAGAAIDGRLEALRDRPEQLWFVRTPGMTDVGGNPPPNIADHIADLVELLTFRSCPLACSPASCACLTGEAS
jgi:hypothetical protein